MTKVYFVSTTIVGFLKIFDRDTYRILIDDLKFYQDRGDFVIIAFVLMPNHIHLVLNTLGSLTISQCIGNLKRLSSRRISSHLENRNDHHTLKKLRDKASLEAARDCRVWKPRFDCLTLFKEKTLIQKIEYCHLNPVRKGLATEPEDWPYSSARNYAGRLDTVIPVDTEWKCLVR